MKSKLALIIICVILAALSAYGGAYLYFATLLPFGLESHSKKNNPWIEGFYRGYVSEGSAICFSLKVTPIEREEYLNAKGNVVRDSAKKNVRRFEYYSLELSQIDDATSEIQKIELSRMVDSRLLENEPSLYVNDFETITLQPSDSTETTPWVSLSCHQEEYQVAADIILFKQTAEKQSIKPLLIHGGACL